mmetsp:Transcript_1456/g.1955  ORF Transcript_1456/g.1955 Transcript_1456/m.1955 type:complete len:1097 (+) Transcript_1456:122-3412(+)
MFDGNHRVRRDINLSGNRRRRTVVPPKNFLTGVEDRKAVILENSRRQREQRRLLQKKIKSATLIEKVVRGWLARSFLVEELQKGFSTSTPILASELSMLVALTNDYREPLLAYSKQSITEKSNFDKVVTNLAKQRILQSALKMLCVDAEKENLLQLIQKFLQESGNNISHVTCLALIAACQCWMVNHANEVTTIQSLWRWSCQAAAVNPSKQTLALLALTLFGYAESMEYQSVAAAYFGANNPNQWTYQVLLDALVESILASDEDVTKMIKNSESKVVYRSIELYEALVTTNEKPNPHVIISLIEAILSLSHEASILTVLQIRGENVRSIVLDGVVDDVKQSARDDDDSDDDEMKDVSPFTSQKNQSQKITTPRLTRQQVQTIPRLNQLYQDDLWRIRQDILSQLKGRSTSHKTNVVELAEYLGNAKLWQQWAEVKTPDHGNLRLLGRLLQGCSGFKSTATSPFLSQLAYSEPFLDGLWRQTLLFLVNGSADEKLTLYATIVFCDVFSHHLISLSDKDFLECYTTANSKPVILAEHVVTYLKPLLHDLYWNKPVLAADVKADDDIAHLRARMLLSGTKLWNSLYERWSRLVRQAPFCDELCWFFPRLASRDDDGAVIGSRENNTTTTEYDDNDYMEIDSDSDGEEGITGTELENDALADTFRDPKMARVLTSIPQAIPFDRRVKLFNSLLNADKLKTQDESADFRRAIARMMERGEDNDLDIGGRERVEIRRDSMYKDSMSQLNGLGRRLKSKVQVTMINKHGAHEAGIDGGGVFKEFIDDLISEAFLNKGNVEDAPKLFSVTPLQTLAVNMDVANVSDRTAHYEFLGRVLGKAVYESILVEPQFCLPFLNQLLGKLNSLEDLKNYDPEFYINLTKLRTMSEIEIKNLGLTFELNMGSKQTVPLVPGGSSILVTKHNVIHYVYLVANQRLNVESAKQTKAFLRGFRDLIPASWVRLFSAYELQKLIGGDDTVLDIEKLKVSMQYAGGYHPSQPIIQWFWEILEEFTQGQQRQFLRFVTSCSRQPLLGFQGLEPAPCIQQIHLPDALLGSEEAEKHVPLPTSSTCMNLLKLPNYKNKALLRKKLIDAIEAGAGFELT